MGTTLSHVQSAETTGCCTAFTCRSCGASDGIICNVIACLNCLCDLCSRCATESELRMKTCSPTRSFCTHHSPGKGWLGDSHETPVVRASTVCGPRGLSTVRPLLIATQKRRRTFTGSYNDDERSRALFANLDMMTQELTGLYSQTTVGTSSSRRKRGVYEENTSEWSIFDPTGVPQVEASVSVFWHTDGQYYDDQVVDVDEETREIRIEYEDGDTENFKLNEIYRDRVHLLSESAYQSPAYQRVVETVCRKHNQCTQCKTAAIRWPNFQMCTRCTSAKWNGFHTYRVVE